MNEEVTPMTHVYKGMFRPPWDDRWANPGGYVQCTCGHVLQTTVGVREHWQAGHFDYPVYEKIEKPKE